MAFFSVSRDIHPSIGIERLGIVKSSRVLPSHSAPETSVLGIGGGGGGSQGKDGDIRSVGGWLF